MGWCLRLVIILIVGLIKFNLSFAVEHPFLIVKKSMYSELRLRATQEPWRSLRSDAIARAKALSYPASGNVYNRSAEGMRDIMNTCALAYILDDANRVFYKNKIFATLSYWPALYQDMRPNIWEDSVPPGNGFVMSILALDIIYDDLTEAQKTQAINYLRPPFSDWPFDWPHNGPGTKAVWYLFLEDRTNFLAAKQTYLADLYNSADTGGYILSDGAYIAGSSYAMERLGGTKSRGASKGYVMDILAFTGEHNFYADSRLQSFFNWLLVFSLNPFRGPTIFGDSIVDKGSYWSNARSHSLNLFGGDLGALAARVVSSPTAVADKSHSLFAYILTRSAMPAPKKAESEIFWRSGAAFWENNISENAIMGALWSPARMDGHSHKEVNAIYLAAYGEHILLNSGYAGWGKGIGGFDWSWISRNARSSNTVLVDDVDHALGSYAPIPGKGITEGFTSSYLDYASGDSGLALPNGRHQRNFLFVHPQDGSKGYFILLDEVVGQAGTKTAHLVLHPNSDSHSVVTTDTEFKWQINGPFRRRLDKPTYVSLFLGTAPAAVTFKSGPIAGGSLYQMSDYLQSSFALDGRGEAQLLTVIFPHDSTYLKPSFRRISRINEFSGVEVDHGTEGIDIGLAPKGVTPILFNNIQFSGKGALLRIKNNSSAFFFARQATFFDDGRPSRKAFSASRPISIHLRGGAGQIISPGADVEFIYPNLTSIKVNGQTLSPISTGADRIKVHISSGTFSIALITTPLSTNPIADDPKRPEPPTGVQVKISN